MYTKEMTTISNQSGKIVVLMSGGIDSSATVAACLETAETVSGLFIDYGQPAASSEWEAAQKVAKHFGIDLDSVRLGFNLKSSEGEYFGRNALFILTAAGTAENSPLVIATGIHALSDYYDTTP